MGQIPQQATIEVTAVLSHQPKLNSRSAAREIAKYIIDFTTERILTRNDITSVIQVCGNDMS